MPNYNIVIDTSQFRPFDYSLALNAIHDYNTGYEKSLAVYDKISQTLGDLASAVEGSTKAKLIYDAYQNRFKTAADEFSRGMNVRTARELGQLRSMYGTLIRLLERANEAMVKEAERRRIEKDPTMMYQNIGTLDDYMENPNRTLGRYSATQLTNDVSALAGAVGKSIIDRANNGRLDNYTKTWIQTKGFREADVTKAITEVQQGGIEAVTDPIYKNILQSAMNSSGIYGWADEATKRQAEIAAARGLYGGIGESTMGTYEDYAAKKATDHYYHELEAANQQQRALDLLKAKQDQALNGAIGTYGRSYLDEKDANGNTRYLNIQTNMQSLLDTQGNIKSQYQSEKMKRSGISPMAVYEAYHKYAQEHKRTPKPGDGDFFTHLYQSQYTGGGPVPDYAGALQYIKQQYGVDAVLSTQQYETMKQLGYDDGKAFAISHGGKNNTNIGQDYLERLNNLAQRNTTSFASGEKINKLLADRIGRGLSWYQSNNALKEVNGKLEPVDNADWDKITKDDIVDIGVDIGKEKLVFVTKDGVKYAVDPNIISKDFEIAWDRLLNTGIRNAQGEIVIASKKDIENSNMPASQKAQALYNLQEAVLIDLMKHVGRGNFQVLSETTSKDE